MKKFFKIILIFSIFLAILFCFIKNILLKEFFYLFMNKKFPSISMEKINVNYEIPDEILFSSLVLNDPTNNFHLTADSINVDFNPSIIVGRFTKSPIYSYLNSVCVNIKNLKYGVFLLDDIFFRVDKLIGDTPDYGGQLNIEKIKYRKIQLDKIYSLLEIKNDGACINIVSMDIAGGKSNGKIDIRIDNGKIIHKTFINFNNIDSADILLILGLNSKMEMTGKWNGELTIEGINKTVTVCDGFFESVNPGGILTIRDKHIIDRILPANRIASEQFSSSLMNHIFDNGKMKASIEQSSIRVNLILEGDTGVRDFDVYLHNFFNINTGGE